MLQNLFLFISISWTIFQGWQNQKSLLLLNVHTAMIIIAIPTGINFLDELKSESKSSTILYPK